MLDSAMSTVESVVTTLTSKCCSSCSLLLHLLELIVSVSAFALVLYVVLQLRVTSASLYVYLNITWDTEHCVETWPQHICTVNKYTDTELHTVNEAENAEYVSKVPRKGWAKAMYGYNVTLSLLVTI